MAFGILADNGTMEKELNRTPGR